MEPSELQFEQATVSPQVNQFLTDYLFVHKKLKAEDINPTLDVGMGDADIALSIVNDAYNHQRADKAEGRKLEEFQSVPPTDIDELKEILGITDAS